MKLENAWSVLLLERKIRLGSTFCLLALASLIELFGIDLKAEVVVGSMLKSCFTDLCKCSVHDVCDVSFVLIRDRDLNITGWVFRLV